MMRYMTEDRRGALARGLFDKYIELQRKREKKLKTYEIAFQDVIETICPKKLWWEVTRCNIFMHLCEHKDPEATVIEILKQLMED